MHRKKMAGNNFTPYLHGLIDKLHVPQRRLQRVTVDVGRGGREKFIGTQIQVHLIDGQKLGEPSGQLVKGGALRGVRGPAGLHDGEERGPAVGGTVRVVAGGNESLDNVEALDSGVGSGAERGDFPQKHAEGPHVGLGGEAAGFQALWG